MKLYIVNTVDPFTKAVAMSKFIASVPKDKRFGNLIQLTNPTAGRLRTALLSNPVRYSHVTILATYHSKVSKVISKVINEAAETNNNNVLVLAVEDTSGLDPKLFAKVHNDDNLLQTVIETLQENNIEPTRELIGYLDSIPKSCLTSEVEKIIMNNGEVHEIDYNVIPVSWRFSDTVIFGSDKDIIKMATYLEEDEVYSTIVTTIKKLSAIIKSRYPGVPITEVTSRHIDFLKRKASHISTEKLVQRLRLLLNLNTHIRPEEKSSQDYYLSILNKLTENMEVWDET